MSKPKKVIRSHYMYKKQTHRVRNTFLFLLLVIVLVGVGYILSKEWAKRFGPDAPQPPSTSQTPPSSEPAPSSAPASSEPAPSVSAGLGRGVTLTTPDAVKTGDALTQMLTGYKEQGYQFVVFDLKADDGHVLFDSQNEMARAYGAVSPGAYSLDGLTAAIRQAGLTPVGRISALKDPLAAHVRNKNSFGYENDPTVNWIDNNPELGGKPWLNPYMENARNYVSGLCREAAGRGVEVLLLSNVNFPATPYQSKMGLLNETASRAEILRQLMAECQAAAGEVPVYNSYDAVWAGLGGANETAQGPGVRLAPVLDLDAIAANRQALCARYGLADEATPTEAAAALLQKGPGAAPLEEDAVQAELPILRQKDLGLLAPTLKKLKITNYIVT